MADVSLIPKESKSKSIFVTIFSKIGIWVIVLLFLSLGAYGALYYYNNSLNAEFQDLKDQVEEMNKQRDAEFEKKVLSLERRMLFFEDVFENHTYWSNVFSKLEEVTIPQVRFKDFNGRVSKDGSVNIDLDGHTSGYTYLAKQMVSFLDDKLVSNLEVSNLSLTSEGGIEFSFNVNFLKDILNK